MKKQKATSIDFPRQLRSVRRFLITAVLLTILAIWIMYDATARDEKIDACLDERTQVQQGRRPVDEFF